MLTITDKLKKRQFKDWCVCIFFFFANSNGGRNRNEKIKNDYRAKEGKKKKKI